MRTRLYILGLLLILVLVGAGCASPPKFNADGSPAWTTSVPKDSRTLHYAVGSAKQSTPHLSQLRAEAAAKDSVGRWASTVVDTSLVTYIEEAGEYLKDKQTLEALQNLSVQTVSIALREVSVVERYVGADGTVWVLCSYPKQNLKQAYALQSEALERSHTEAKLKAEVMIAYLENQLEQL